jgi:hypothetical protein
MYHKGMQSLEMIDMLNALSWLSHNAHVYQSVTQYPIHMCNDYVSVKNNSNTKTETKRTGQPVFPALPLTSWEPM